VDEYYRDVMQATAKAKKPALPRPPKQPVLHDYQFYPERLHDLLEKETAAYRRRLEARKSGKDEEGDDTDYGDLTKKEENLKNKLLQQGFSNWNRREFHQFVKACERYGRKDVTAIAADMESKTEKEVRAYMQVFKQKYETISGWERIMDRIAKGEEKLARLDSMQATLADKVTRYKDPFRQLKITYGHNRGKSFTTEEDVFLLCMTHELGYGRWDELKMEIRRAWQFRFDWFLKSRTPQELNRRVDVLIRLVEKENEEMEEKQGKKRKKSQKTSGKKRSASSSSVNSGPARKKQRRK